MKRCLIVLSCLWFCLSHSLASDDATRVIRQYVAKTKHWKQSVYRIEPKGHEGIYLVYDVIYIPDEHHRELVTGAGESFAVYYDQRSQRIVREMHFQ